MLINTSSLKFNVTFKGREIGFAPYETKNITHILTESDEKVLASRYKFLIFKPNPAKKTPISSGLPTVDSLSKVLAKDVENVQKQKEAVPLNEPDSPSVTAEYTSKETVEFAEKDSSIIREDDLKDAVDKVESIPLSKTSKESPKIIGDDEYDDAIVGTEPEITIPEDYNEMVQFAKKLIQEGKIRPTKLNIKKADLTQYLKYELGLE